MFFNHNTRIYKVINIFTLEIDNIQLCLHRQMNKQIMPVAIFEAIFMFNIPVEGKKYQNFGIKNIKEYN